MLTLTTEAFEMVFYPLVPIRCNIFQNFYMSDLNIFFCQYYIIKGGEYDGYIFGVV